MIYEIGDTIPLLFTLPANDGTATLTVTDPAGATTVTAGIAGAGGTYSGTYKPTVAGLFNVAWSTTNNAHQDVFDVRGVLQSIVSVDDVRTFLRLRTTDTSDNSMLQDLIETASDLIEDVTGPLRSVTYTEWFDGGSGTYVVAHPPIVLNSASMKEYYGTSAYTLTEQPLGGQMSAYAFTIDYTTGQVTRRTFGGQAAMFAQGSKNVYITYTASRNPVPASIQMATRELVKHLYTATQIPAGARGSRARENEEGMTPSATFAVPNFVLDMIPLKYRRPPGVA